MSNSSFNHVLFSKSTLAWNKRRLKSVKILSGTENLIIGGKQKKRKRRMEENNPRSLFCFCCICYGAIQRKWCSFIPIAWVSFVGVLLFATVFPTADHECGRYGFPNGIQIFLQSSNGCFCSSDSKAISLACVCILIKPLWERIVLITLFFLGAETCFTNSLSSYSLMPREARKASIKP